MKGLLLIVVFVVCGYLVNAGGKKKEKIHLKIHVPKIIKKEHHTKIVYIHKYDKDDHKDHGHKKKHKHHDHGHKKEVSHKHTVHHYHHKGKGKGHDHGHDHKHESHDHGYGHGHKKADYHYGTIHHSEDYHYGGGDDHLSYGFEPEKSLDYHHNSGYKVLEKLEHNDKSDVYHPKIVNLAPKVYKYEQGSKILDDFSSHENYESSKDGGYDHIQEYEEYEKENDGHY